MSIYMSDALKGRINEEDLLDDPEELRKTNFSERMYIEILLKNDRICVPVVKLKQENASVFLEINLPDNTLLFQKVLSISAAKRINFFLTNDNQEASDILACDFTNKDIDVLEVRQSLLGYNYLATIVIKDCVVF